MIAYHNMTISILKDLLLGKVINGQSWTWRNLA
jgi:hypothetical protein